MPTESFRIADAGGCVKQRFNATLPMRIVEGMYAALIEAGWENASAHAATSTLSLPPWSPPAVTVPDETIPEEEKTLVGDPTGDTVFAIGTRRLAKIQGIYLCQYDPYRERVEPLDNVIWVPLGLTRADGVAALVSAIGATAWQVSGPLTEDQTGFTKGYIHIPLTANTPGPEMNGIEFGGQGVVEGDNVGYLSVALAPRNGGWTLRATTWYGWLEVRIDVRDYTFWGAQMVCEFRASTGGTNPVVMLLSGADEPAYTILANRYQFFVFDGAGTAHYRRLLATLPSVDEEDAHGVTYAAIVCGYGAWSWRERLQWIGDVWTAANGGFGGELGASRYPGSYPGIYMSKAAGPLRDSPGRTVAESAFIGAPPSDAPYGPAGQARIVGRLWDAFIVREDYPLDSEAVFRGRTYQCVARATEYSRPQGTLWVAISSGEEES